MVQQTADESARASGGRSGPRRDRWPPSFAAVFADRAQSMVELRAAIDGYLGMQPIPATGTAAGTVASTEATGTTLRDARHEPHRGRGCAAGAGRLPVRLGAPVAAHRCEGTAGCPRSGSTNPQLWQLGPVASQVDLMASSPSLAAAHDLVLRTVRLDPADLADAAGRAGQRVGAQADAPDPADVVLANDGSVDEPRARSTTRWRTSPGGHGSQDETRPSRSATSETLPPGHFAVSRAPPTC